ncbi:MAG TPA: hypothetical protein PLY88_00950 [Candidatus Omnitrophota bacterium]|nr:hypothetical protein [Candidatus Omnitrophota bacterium]
MKEIKSNLVKNGFSRCCRFLRNLCALHRRKNFNLLVLNYLVVKITGRGALAKEEIKWKEILFSYSFPADDYLIIEEAYNAWGNLMSFELFFLRLVRNKLNWELIAPKSDIRHEVLGNKQGLNIGAPVIYVMWHHGAYFICKLLLKIMPHATLHYNDKLFPAQNVAIIIQSIKTGHSILHFIDGKDGKRNVMVPFLSKTLFIPSSIIKIARMMKVPIMPITAYFYEHDDMNQIYIGDPLFTQDELEAMTDQAAILTIWNYFMKDLKEKAPWSTNPWVISLLSKK